PGSAGGRECPRDGLMTCDAEALLLLEKRRAHRFPLLNNPVLPGRKHHRVALTTPRRIIARLLKCPRDPLVDLRLDRGGQLPRLRELQLMRPELRERGRGFRRLPRGLLLQLLRASGDLGLLGELLGASNRRRPAESQRPEREEGEDVARGPGHVGKPAAALRPRALGSGEGFATGREARAEV